MPSCPKPWPPHKAQSLEPYNPQQQALNPCHGSCYEHCETFYVIMFEYPGPNQRNCGAENSPVATDDQASEVPQCSGGVIALWLRIIFSDWLIAYGQVLGYIEK